VPLPILNAILPSNELQVQRGVEMVMRKGRRRVGVLGFSFKAGTDDLRESPVVEVIERLIGKGYDLKVYDRNVNMAALTGANRDYILNHIPHISRIMVDSIDAVMAHAEVLLIGNGAPEFKQAVRDAAPHLSVVDLVRVGSGRSEGERYDGICW
jgi:GDP-mannose 6-dehydrogenase